MRLGSYVDEWTKKPFSDVFEILSNNTYSRADLNYEMGNYKNIHYGDVLIKFPSHISATDSEVPFISVENEIAALSKILLKNGDVIIADTAEDYTVGKATEIEDADKVKVVSGLHTIPCRPRISFAKHFLGHYINSTAYHTQLIPYIQGVKVSSISKALIKNTTISFPSIREQNDIAIFLSKVDQRIEAQNKIISKYESLIKGISKHLLSETEKFDNLQLSNILIEYNEKTSIKNECPILSSTMSGIYIQSEYFNKQAASEDTIGYNKVPYGYCTYRSMSDTGEFRFNLQNLVDIGSVSPAYPVFTSHKYDIEFIVFYLNNSMQFKKQIIEAKEGGTRFALSYSKLKKLYIPRIDKIRQKRIVTIFNSFTQELDIEMQYLKKIKEQKSYLLSKMFI